MMKVSNLSNTTFDQLLECFLLAFENYYLKFPTDKNYYKQRWKAAKVDFNLSYGMFDMDQLVGFIIHAVDKRAGILTAFNTGTGVIPEYRGKKISKSMYDFAIQDLRQKGIVKSTLEVITKNEIAIHTYESVGFKITKKYCCFSGAITIESNEPFELKELLLKDIDWDKLPRQHYYSWDFQKETILASNNKFYQVIHNNQVESFFIINPENHTVSQFDILQAEGGEWERLYCAIKHVASTIRIINLDDRLTDKLDSLKLIGLEHTIDQYEMELEILTKKVV